MVISAVGHGLPIAPLGDAVIAFALPWPDAATRAREAPTGDLDTPLRIDILRAVFATIFETVTQTEARARGER